MTKKAVIFDLDGTLVDSLKDISASMNKALQSFGLPPHAAEDYRWMTGNGAMTLTQRAVGERADMTQAVYEAYREEYALHCRDHVEPYPDIRMLLETLKVCGLKLAVVSNKDDADARAVLSAAFPLFRFDAVLGRRDGMPLKPDPAAPLLAARLLSIEPEACWYLGDTETDLKCAKAAQMEFVAAGWGYGDRRTLLHAPNAFFAENADAALAFFLQNT